MIGLRIFFYALCAMTVSILVFVIYLIAVDHRPLMILWNCGNFLASLFITHRVYEDVFEP